MPDERLPALTIQPCDPTRVFAELIKGRHVIYLDNNVWIELRESSGAAAAACRASCEAAADGGVAIFPVSLASVSELMAMLDRTARQQQATLQDRLCRGVTMRAPSFIRRVEAADAYHFIFHGVCPPPRHSHAFTNIVDFVGTSSLSFPSGSRPSDIERFTKECWRRISLSDLVRLQDDTDLTTGSNDTYEADTDGRHAEQWKHFASGRKLDRKRVLREERTFLFLHYILPVLRGMLLASQPEMTPDEIRTAIELGARRLGKEPQRLATLLRTATPSIELSAQLFVQRALEPHRKTKPQDFWDMEHACIAPIYADAVVTSDGGMLKLLRASTGKVRACAKTKILSSVEELGDLVEQLRSTKRAGKAPPRSI